MPTLFHTLWRGNYQPMESPKLEKDPAYRLITQALAKDERALRKLLPQEHLHLLDNYYNRFVDLNGLEAEAAFASGFSLAVRLLTESLALGQ